MNELAVVVRASRSGWWAGRIGHLPSGSGHQIEKPIATHGAGEGASGGGARTGAGHALIWPERAAYIGRLLENEAHAHHAIQISIALEGMLSLQTAPDERWSPYRAVATASDQLHRIRCRGAIAQIYVDPESAVGLALRERLGDAGVRPLEVGELGALPDALRAWFCGELDTEELGAAIDDAMPVAAPASASTPMDPRVREALDVIHTSPGRRVPLAALARRVGLSPSRLGALFRRNTGIPVRRYLLWLRLTDAIEALSDGINLTEAAHHAGFSDSAHLSRTFRHMFGMPPSALQAQSVEIRRLTP